MKLYSSTPEHRPRHFPLAAWLSALSATCLLAGVTTSASAATIDCSSCVVLQQNGVDLGAVPLIEIGDNQLGIAPGSQTTFLGGNNSSITLSGFSYDTDPTLTFALGAVNKGSTPASFGAVFNLPLNPTLKEPLTATSTVRYTLTDGGTNGITISPSIPAIGKIVSAQDVDANGIAFDKGVNVGDTCTATTDAFCGPYNAGPSLINHGAGPYVSMTANVNFNLTGGGDAASLSGKIIQAAVPEPSSYALLSAGLVFVGFVASRRMKS